ncbi:MAG TPA: formate dehydrogenase accessory protein FdhE [Terriglobales bacterium]|nr:formate dehydrogenase accessory protein FdhE [Terriglobales bacterium]
MKLSKWDQRIQRAERLAETHPFAEEVLRFYKEVAMLQRELYFSFERLFGGTLDARENALLDTDLNLDPILPSFGVFLSRIQTIAPGPIRASASNLQSQGVPGWRDSLTSSWWSSPDFQPAAGDGEALLASMFLQPLAEFLADRSSPQPRGETLAICPVCNARPLVGVLRPEGDGAKRSLICSRCATEWAFRRIVCPACGEETVDKLAVYTATQFEHVRVEACDTCRYYIKTVDLTKNGHAVPVVDELATIPLNLWAQEHDYVKLRANLLGI